MTSGHTKKYGFTLLQNCLVATLRFYKEDTLTWPQLV